jgi:hypothetical protein
MSDPVKDSPPSLLQEPALALTIPAALASGSLPRDNHGHEKLSEAWKDVDLSSSAFLQDLGEFFELFLGC